MKGAAVTNFSQLTTLDDRLLGLRYHSAQQEMNRIDMISWLCCVTDEL